MPYLTTLAYRLMFDVYHHWWSNHSRGDKIYALLDNIGIEVKLLSEGRVQSHQLSSLAVLRSKGEVILDLFKWAFSPLECPSPPSKPPCSSSPTPSHPQENWMGVVGISLKIKMESRPASSSVHFREVHLLKVNLGIKNKVRALAISSGSTLAPIWSKTSWVESMISGPTPSPGINVTGTLPGKRPRWTTNCQRVVCENKSEQVTKTEQN